MEAGSAAHAASNVALGTTAFIEVLAAAVVVAIVADRVRLPAAVALVGFGAIVASLGPVDLPFSFGPAVLFVFLPPLIFEAAWSLDAGALRRMAWPIAVLAVPGVVVTAGIVGLGMAAAGVLPAIAAAAFGAIVAPTDPVAVIAIFRRLGIPIDLATLVEGESIANDGIAIALYGIALAAAGSAAHTAFWPALGAAATAVLGGIAVGIATAVVVGLAIRGAREPAVELTATIVLAFGAYGIATSLGWSGVFASAGAGVTLRAISGAVFTARSPADVDRFWEAIAFVANAFVFVAVGLMLWLPRLAREPALVGGAVVLVAVSRVPLAFGLLPLTGRTVRAPGWRTATFVAGMRGALSLALALGLPADFPARQAVVDATVAVVLTTLVVQGATVEPILARLPLRRR